MNELTDQFPSRVLCCGDRHWTDYEFIHKVLLDLPSGTLIIQGCAKGADTAAANAAAILGMKVLAFPAQWSRYGRAAGPIRNTQMLDEGLPTIVFAFHDNLAESKGTRNMIDQALACGIPVKVFTHEEGTRT